MTSTTNNQNDEGVSQQALDDYSKSQRLIKNVVMLTEAMLVAFTLPHNIDAFGLDFSRLFSQLFSSQFFPTLLTIIGVLVLECVFVTAVTHFTHGWLASAKQRTAAYWTAFTLAAILALNAIAAQLMHLSETVGASGGLMGLVLAYSGFALPITPILAVALLGWLISQHPAIIAHAAEFQHIAKMQSMKQAAEINYQEARTRVRLQEIEAKQATAEAKLEENNIKTAVKLARIKADGEEERQKLDYDLKAKQAVLDAKGSKLDETLQSPEFKKDIDEIVTGEVASFLRQSKRRRRG